MGQFSSVLENCTNEKELLDIIESKYKIVFKF